MQHKLRKEDFVELVEEFLMDNDLMNEFIDYILKRGEIKIDDLLDEIDNVLKYTHGMTAFDL